MRKTAKRGKFRKRLNKTRRRQNGGDRFWSTVNKLRGRDIENTLHMNRQLIKQGIMRDTPVVVITNYNKRVGEDKEFDWFPTYLFYATIRKLADYDYWGNMYDNKDRLSIILEWIRENYIHNRKTWYGTKETNYKLVLVPAYTVLKDFNFNTDARRIPVSWFYNEPELKKLFGVSI
jgi:hypothetical protein